MHARNLQTFALHEVTPATGHAAIAVATEPPDLDPVADGEILDAVADLGDGARDLVSGGDGPGEPGKGTVDEGVVGAAHTGRLDVDAHVVAWRRRGFNVDEGQRRTR